MLLAASCTKDDEPAKYDSTGNPALVIVAENNDGLLTGDLASLFEQYRTQAVQALAQLFEIDAGQMDGMSLNEIIENFGEPWQLKSISNSAENHYRKIIILRNDKATLPVLLDSLKYLSANKYDIDMVFCLHGSPTSISLSDGSHDIADFTGRIKSAGVKIRALYQTCCYAAETIDEWSGIGLQAVNGAVGRNQLTMFSPAYFIDEWTSGRSFKDAVSRAREREIEKLKTYGGTLPVFSIFLTGQVLTESSHKFGGANPGLMWSEFPI